MSALIYSKKRAATFFEQTNKNYLKPPLDPFRALLAPARELRECQIGCFFLRRRRIRGRGSVGLLLVARRIVCGYFQNLSHWRSATMLRCVAIREHSRSEMSLLSECRP
jgi:hypothetical protein